MSRTIVPVGNVIRYYFSAPPTCQRRFRDLAKSLVCAEDFVDWQTQQLRAWKLLKAWRIGTAEGLSRTPCLGDKKIPRFTEGFAGYWQRLRQHPEWSRFSALAEKVLIKRLTGTPWSFSGLKQPRLQKPLQVPRRGHCRLRMMRFPGRQLFALGYEAVREILHATGREVKEKGARRFSPFGRLKNKRLWDGLREESRPCQDEDM